MRYEYTYRNTPGDYWKFRMENYYRNWTALVSIVFTLSILALTVAKWNATNGLGKALMVICLLLFPVLQPLYIYYNHGEYGSWRDNAEIQEFISLLIENGYLEGKHFLETAGANEGAEKKKITMDELNELSKKGDELSASDLEEFEYTEKGNGSVSRQYDIADDDDKFRFTVEFTDKSCTDIMSAELYSVEVDAVTDIREVTVAQFLHMIRNQIESSEDK